MRGFSDGLVKVARTATEVLGEDGLFDTHAGYLDADRVIAVTLEGPTVLLTAGSLGLIDVIDYPEGAVSQWPRPSGRATWTTFEYDTGRVQLWRL